MSVVFFVFFKVLIGWVDSGMEKFGLVVFEFFVRKSFFEYKLEGRFVLCLKLIEGILDIVFLLGF